MNQTRASLAQLLPFAVFALAGGLAAWAVGPPVAAPRPPETGPLPDDPVPIRRVLLPADRLPAELKRLPEGALTRWPRDEFDRLVRAAAGGKPAAPRLVEARYQARLTDRALSGTARWKVLHPGKGPALLKLAPDNGAFSLALSRPRAGEREMVIADFSGPKSEKGFVPSLLVEGPGELDLRAGWTVRGDARPEGLRLDLRLPECPVAELELDLPADAAPTLPEGAVAFASRPAGEGRRLHRIACGGKGHLPLVIRRAEASQPVVLAWQQVVQRLAPDGVRITATFDLQALYRDLDEVIFELSPGLRPLAVTTPAGDRWERRDGAGGATELVVRLARPARDLTVEVQCLTPLATAGGARGLTAWVSPAVRVRGAIPRGEQVEIWLHPELRALTFAPGDFRLRESGPRLDDEQVRWQRLVLVGGGVARAAGAPPVRPSARVEVGGVAVDVRQHSWWQVGAGGMTLTARLEQEVRQGLLFELRAAVPAGWEVESVELTPEGTMRSWGVRQGKSGAELLVDLRQPLRPGRPGVLTAQLRSMATATDREVPFPDLRPIGARLREGGLALEYDELLYRAAVGGANPTGLAPANGPWGRAVPDAFFPFAGDAPTGTVRLVPRPARYRGRVQQEVFFRGPRAFQQVRLTLEAESGAPGHFDLWSLSREGANWSWQAEARPGAAGPRIVRAERLRWLEVGAALGALASRSPLHSLAHAAALPGAALWRYHLDRPLAARQRVVFVVSGELTPRGRDEEKQWEVPLLALAPPRRFDGEVILHFAGAEPVSVTPLGLREGTASAGGAAARGLRYQQPGGRLVVVTRAHGPEQVEATIDHARLTTRLSGGGRLVHQLRFRLRNWPRRSLPMELPSGASLLAVTANGRWLPNVSASADGVLALPVPIGEDGNTTYEIAYATEGEAPRVAGRLTAPLPALPVPPRGLERRWLLPPSLVPLTRRAAWRVPGTGEQGPWRAPSRALELFRLGPHMLLPGRTVDRRPERQQALADALAGLHNDRPRAKLRLGAVLEELVSHYLRDAHPLVLDAAALEQAGVTPDTPVTLGGTAEPWGTVGLATAGSGPGALLTTRAQLDRWANAQPPSDVERATASAVLYGHDPSGRFLTAVEWLARQGPRAGPPAAWAEDEGQWAVWVPGPGSEDLTVVRRELGTTLGLGASVLVLLALILARSWARQRWSRVLLLWIGLAGVALPWVPESLREVVLWPLVVGLATSAVVFLRWANQSPPAPSPPPRLSSRLTTGMGLLALLGAAGLAAAQRAEPETVYLLPAPAGTKGEGTVLLTPRLAEALRALARPPLAPPTGAVLVSADYRGGLTAGRAELEATFRAHCVGEGPHQLQLPLEEAQLVGDVLLDGVKAYPVALPAPRSGYRLPVRGAGGHTVVIRFRVAVTAIPDDPRQATGPGQRTIKFTPPRLVQSRLTFRVPGGKELRVPTRLGEAVARQEKEVGVIEADLGPVAGAVQVRWYQEARPARAARVEYREAHLWDLRPDGSVLTTLARYDISGGVVTALLVDVPPELELRSALARRPSGVTEAPVRLRDWSLSGSGEKRQARLSFPAPVNGPVELALELMPRAPWAGEVLLPLPRPHGLAQGTGHLAYRARGVEVVRKQSLALTGIPARNFAPFWPTATRPLAKELVSPSSFRRAVAQSPELRVEVRPAASRLTASQEVTLHVGPRQAELVARLELSAPDKDLSLVEWEIASARPVRVKDITGPEVHRWAQSGNRLLVWFKETTGAARLELTGWLPLTRPGEKPSGGDTHFDLPTLRALGTTTATTRLRLTAVPGLQLARPSLRQLAAVGGEGPGLHFQARAANYGGSFTVEPGPLPTATIRTQGTLQGKQLRVATTIDYASRGQGGEVTVRVRGALPETSLEAPEGTVLRRREQSRLVGGRLERTWVVELAPAARARVTLTVRGRGAIDEEGLALPEVAVLGATQNRTVHLEEGLDADVGPGLAALGGPARAWRVTTDEWALRAVPRSLPRQAAVEGALTELRARVEARRWAYQVEYVLWQEGPAEVSVRWAGEVEVLAASIDDVPTVAQAVQGRLWLPLPARVGPCRITVRYRLPGGSNLARPSLVVPVLEGATRAPVVWTVEVPPRWEVGAPVGAVWLGAGMTRRAGVEARRAAVALAHWERLATAGRPTEAVQERARRALWLAGLAVRAGADRDQALGPKGEKLGAWVDRLHKQWEDRAGGELGPGQAPPVGGEIARGTEMSWSGEGEEALAVRLVPVTERETRQALAATAEWLLLWLGMAALALSAFLRALERWVWPELTLLLGVVGWRLEGPRLLVVFLLALGVIGRGLLLVQWAQAWWQKAPPAPGSSVAR